MPIIEAVEPTVTWGLILKLAFTTGLSTAFLNQVIGLAKEEWQRRRGDKKKGRVAALELVEILTAFAQECEARREYNEYDRSLGDNGRYSHIPPLSKYPNDIGWETIPPVIAGALVDLRNEIKQAERKISITAEVVDPEEATVSADTQFTSLARMATQLAQRLRDSYGLGKYHSTA
jgi:hypothetical protein